MTEPYYRDADVTLHLGDCLDVLRAMEASSIDAVVTDPPYALGFMGKTWDSPGSFVERPANREHRWDHVGGNHNPVDSADAARTRRVEGQRFQAWCQQWAGECLRVLKPGGWLLAFGGTRTWHRLVCGIEDAGFEVRDAVADLTGYDAAGLMWVYGSGFPKSLDVSKAIDKARRDDVTHVTVFLRAARGDRPLTEAVRRLGFDGVNGTHGVAAFFTDDPAKARVPSMAHWAVLRELYGFGDAMDAEVARLNDRKGKGSDEWRSRPAADYERRPGMAESWTDGSGWTGIDARGGEAVRPDAARWEGWGTALKPGWEPVAVGRKPLGGTVAGNVLAYGTGAINIDGCRVATADDMHRTRNTALGVMNDDGWLPQRQESDGHDAGRWPPNVVLGPAAAAELDRQSGVTPSSARADKGVRDGSIYGGGKGPSGPGGPRGHADSGGASRFFPVFRYEAKAPASERPRSEDGTAHPTVKPVDLMRWLVRLVTPPGGLVLDPFAGSGTTAEACIVEGFRCVLAEKDPASAELIVRRLRKPIQPVMFGDVS